MHKFQHEGHHFHYLTAGSTTQPPVIMVHGWDGYTGVWENTVQALQVDYFCIVPDLLGFGDSDKPTGADYSIDAQSRRVLALVDSLAVHRFALIGHSMGAMIAMHIAANLAPERVTKLVSVGGTTGGKLTGLIDRVAGPTRQLIRHAPWLMPVVRTAGEIPPIGKAMFRMFFHDMNVIPYADWAEKRRRVFQPGSAVPSDKTRIAVKAVDLVPDLHKLTVPTLIIHGEQDGTVPVEQAKRAAAHISQSQLRLLPKCGHHPMIEQPDAYFETLLAFLATDRPEV